MDPIGVGVIGLGMSGRSLHCEPLSKAGGFRVAAVCDVEKGRLEEVEGLLGARGYRESQDLIFDPEVDLVVVALGCQMHHGLAIAALDAWGRIVVRTQVEGSRKELEPPEPEGGHPYSAYQFYENLHAAMTAGGELAVKPDETVRVMQVLDAACESARIGSPVGLP